MLPPFFATDCAGNSLSQTQLQYTFSLALFLSLILHKHVILPECSSFFLGFPLIFLSVSFFILFVIICKKLPSYLQDYSSTAECQVNFKDATLNQIRKFPANSYDHYFRSREILESNDDPTSVFLCKANVIPF